MLKKSQIVSAIVIVVVLIANVTLLTQNLYAAQCEARCDDGTVIYCSGPACEGIHGEGCTVYGPGLPTTTSCPSN